LIYNCSGCKTSWNLTILSRVSPQSIPPDILYGFHNNDSDLAIHYASDATLVKKHGAEPDQPEIEIIGTDIDCTEPLRIRIIPEQSLEIKAESVIRMKLGLSRSAFDNLLQNGKLRCVSGQNLKKCRLSGEIIIILQPE
jgi:hypothetical protein